MYPHPLNWGWGTFYFIKETIMVKQCKTCVAYEDAPNMGYGYCHLLPRPANDRLRVDDNDYCLSWTPAKPPKKEKKA